MSCQKNESRGQKIFFLICCFQTAAFWQETEQSHVLERTSNETFPLYSTASPAKITFDKSEDGVKDSASRL